MTVQSMLFSVALGLPAAFAECGEIGVYKHSECASHSYASQNVRSSEDCKQMCCDDLHCMQWTFRSKLLGGGECALTNESLAIGTGFPFLLHTCGIKQGPKPLPTPPPPPTEPSAPGQRWAVIAVGSKGYFNYRHQADGCHAYLLMRKSGIPASNIILMMQDDVASSNENPFFGELYNRPGYDSPNVYEGCEPDYKGNIVTAKLFLSVITGDSEAVNGGKVLKSGPNDHVFLNFIDHGGVGIVAFPNGPMLHVSQLTAGLSEMQEKNMFKELVFYMEACESGSMFSSTFPASGSRMYAVTAANAKESSWGFYCMPKNDTVKGKELHTCLGDLFSIAWMEDTDRGAFGSETISQQVKAVTARTTKSHVTQFGDRTLGSETIGRFEIASSSGSAPGREEREASSAIDVRDIPMHLSYHKWSAQTKETAKAAAWEKYQKVLAARQADDSVFASIVDKACLGDSACVESATKGTSELVDERCHKALVDAVYESCPRRSEDEAGGWSAYNMKYSQVLVNLCEAQADERYGGPRGLEDIVRAACAAPGDATSKAIVV